MSTCPRQPRCSPERLLDHRRFLIIAILFLSALIPTVLAPAAEIRCTGVLGNSGESGASLVHFGPNGGTRECPGIGVVYDRFGTLWSRGGERTLNRYAVDGRLLAQFKLPAGSAANDSIALDGDLLVLKLGTGVYTLPVTATRSVAPNNLKVIVTEMSFGAYDDCVAADDGADVFLLNVRTGQKQPVAKLADVSQLELGADGTVYAGDRAKMHKFFNAAEVNVGGWPRRRRATARSFWAGIGLAALGTGPCGASTKTWSPIREWCSAGGRARSSGTLTRIRKWGAPRPGHHPQRARCRQRHRRHHPSPRVAAEEDAVRHRPPHRLRTRLPRNRARPPGNTWCSGGNWRWDDDPQAPLQNGIPAPEGAGIGQPVMLDNDIMVAPCRRQGKTAFYHGNFEQEVKPELLDAAEGKQKDACGTALYRDGSKTIILVTDAAGHGQTFRVSPEGRCEPESASAVLTTATLVKKWTTLGMKGSDTLIAAADGNVIEFSRGAGHDWSESHRWASWGAAQPSVSARDHPRHGQRQTLGCRHARRHRVVVFSLLAAKPTPLATFGTEDHAGDDSKTLSSPRRYLCPRLPRGRVRCRQSAADETGTPRLIVDGRA